MPSIKRANRTDIKNLKNRIKSKKTKITGREDIEQWIALNEIAGEIISDVYDCFKSLGDLAEKSESNRQNVCSLFNVSNIIPKEIQEEIDAIRFVNMAEEILEQDLYVDVNKTAYYWRVNETWNSLGY